MFEHYHQPLLSRKKFFLRILVCLFISLGLLAFTIFLGAFSFHVLEKSSWIDSILNAVCIMTGLGVMGTFNSSAAKVFTSFYAIFSTIIFFLILAILFSPLLHRFLHRFHLEIDK